MNVIHNYEQLKLEKELCSNTFLLRCLPGAVFGFLVSLSMELAFSLLVVSLVFFLKEFSGFIVLSCAGICICCLGRRNG